MLENGMFKREEIIMGNSSQWLGGFEELVFIDYI